MAKGRLIVVSARLPVSLEQCGDGFRASPSPGGLATTLRSVAAERELIWVGWPGAVVPEAFQPQVSYQLATHGDLRAVFLTPEELQHFYEGTSNRLLWPLFHNLRDRAHYDRASWEVYSAVNARFADEVASIAEPGDVIWVHDYQLALVPQMLRQRGVTQCALGFFLHIPFPGSATYRTLPVREAVLRGMLGADLVSFHAYEYANHFRSSCLRVLGYDSDPEVVFLPGHMVRLGVHPIGIDPEEIRQMSDRPEVAAEYQSLKKQYEGKKVIVGVDRLDYTKGLAEKLEAFSLLLEQHPEWREKAVLIQIASPSRTGVPEYQELKRTVDELVGRVNARFGGLSYTPVVYMNQNVSRDRLTALYRLADVAMVTPLRDGMNLICLEYVAARSEVPGVLLLSEFTGAASSLPGAQLVNPYNVDDMAHRLHGALEGHQADATSFAYMKQFVESNTAAYWAEHFLSDLERTYHDLRQGVSRLSLAGATDGPAPAPAERFLSAKKPLLFLDYDGTLQPHARWPEEAMPSDRVRRLLGDLAAVAKVYVVSGRPADVLDDWLGDLPIGMVCEHGLATREPNAAWERSERPDPELLREMALPVLDDFTARTPGSRVEVKAASIAWHYRGVDPHLGSWRANELMGVLEERLQGVPLFVLHGSRVIEVRDAALSKGRAALRLLASNPGVDAAFCAGNDTTDEEMFEALSRVESPAVLTCRIGSRSTRAQSYLEGPDELIRVLEGWVKRRSSAT